MIELTPTMTKSEAIAAQNANNANFDGPFVSSQIFEKSAALTPTISGNSTTRDLTVPAGSNPNRLTILLTSGTGPTSASSAIRLRVSGGSYYNIVMPSGSGTDNIKSLSMWVPYDLILVNINGTYRYVCLNYFDTLSRANKLSELGFFKLLWSGSWGSGTISLPDHQNYMLFAIRESSSQALYLCIKGPDANVIRGGHVGWTTATTQETAAINISYSGATLTLVAASKFVHTSSSNHTSATSLTLSQIYGVL